MTKPDFIIEEATNVYRTNGYIVSQELSIMCNSTGHTIAFSNDIFFRRTLERDLEYELLFAGRKNKDGKRIPSMAYTRTYIE